MRLSRAHIDDHRACAGAATSLLSAEGSWHRASWMYLLITAATLSAAAASRPWAHTLICRMQRIPSAWLLSYSCRDSQVLRLGAIEDRRLTWREGDVRAWMFGQLARVLEDDQACRDLRLYYGVGFEAGDLPPLTDDRPVFVPKLAGGEGTSKGVRCRFGGSKQMLLWATARFDASKTDAEG